MSAMTLDDFATQVLRPSTLKAIKSGAVDRAIFDPDVLELMADDAEIMEAIRERAVRLNQDGEAA